MPLDDIVDFKHALLWDWAKQWATTVDLQKQLKFLSYNTIHAHSSRTLTETFQTLKQTKKANVYTSKQSTCGDATHSWVHYIVLPYCVVFCTDF